MVNLVPLTIISLFLSAAATPLPTPDTTHDDVSSPWTRPSDKFGPGHHGRAEQHEDVSSPWTRPSDKFGPGHHGKRAEQYQDILSSLIQTAELPEDPEDISLPGHATRPSYYPQLPCETLPKNDLRAEIREKYFPECLEPNPPKSYSSPWTLTSDPEHPKHADQQPNFPPSYADQPISPQDREGFLHYTGKIIDVATIHLFENLIFEIRDHRTGEPVKDFEKGGGLPGVFVLGVVGRKEEEVFTTSHPDSW